MLFMLFML
jgi:Inorganic pyrophosphatase